MRYGILLSTAAALALTSPAIAADSASQTFITKAIQGNLAEVSIGHLAQDHGTTDGVRQFGQQLVADHSAANEKAKQAARALGVTPPTEPTAEQKSEHDKLAAESGPTFDKHFAQMMVDDHNKDIAEYQNEAQSQNDAAGQYAKDSLPTLQKHLSMAQALQNNPKGPAAPNRASNDSGAPYPGANSFTEAQTRTRIETAGFQNVTGLKIDDKGIWRGTATKDNKQVGVAMDYKGNVIQQ